MTTVHEVLKAIGRRKLASELDVRPSAISNAASSGVLPSTWFPTVRKLGTQKGIEVPENIFSWRVPEDVPASQEATQ